LLQREKLVVKRHISGLTKTTASQREIGLLLYEGTHEACDILNPVLTPV
jgi:hypothetical protein